MCLLNPVVPRDDATVCTTKGDLLWILVAKLCTFLSYIILYDWNRVAILAGEAIHVSDGKKLAVWLCMNGSECWRGYGVFHKIPCLLKSTCTLEPSLEILQNYPSKFDDQTGVHFPLKFYKTHIIFLQNHSAVRFFFGNLMEVLIFLWNHVNGYVSKKKLLLL